MKALERGWIQTTWTTEISTRKWVGIQVSAAPSAYRLRSRSELVSAASAKTQLERPDTLDSIAGYTDGREKQGQEPKACFLQLGFPGV
mgnify:FL=1